MLAWLSVRMPTMSAALRRELTCRLARPILLAAKPHALPARLLSARLPLPPPLLLPRRLAMLAWLGVRMPTMSAALRRALTCRLARPILLAARAACPSQPAATTSQPPNVITAAAGKVQPTLAVLVIVMAAFF